MKKGFKYRIYPTQQQEQFLARQFGACRWVYNHFLALHIEDYANGKKYASHYDNNKRLTPLKQLPEYAWLNDVNAQSLQASLGDLATAYKRFFDGVSKYPRFHKRSNGQSCKMPQWFNIQDGKLRIPKLKTSIKIVFHRALPPNYTSCTISNTPSGKYYASFLCDVDSAPLPKIVSDAVGIDMGLIDIVVDSNGNKVSAPKFYRKSEKKLAFQQRKLSRKKGSNNRRKQRLIVAKLHEKIANQRKDFTHKLTRKLVDENQIIIAETLRVKNMLQNHRLAKSVGDVAWGESSRQLTYKSDWGGRTFHQIDTWYASSKTCNNCKHVLVEMPLNIRQWWCPNCKQLNDRDINAAINIRDQGLKELTAQAARLATERSSDAKQKLGPSQDGDDSNALSFEALTAGIGSVADTKVGSMKRDTAGENQW